MFLRALLAIALLGTLTSTAYLVLVILAALRFAEKRRRLRIAMDYTPPVSVLKPVHGVEPNLEENLKSFFCQEYPDFELIFCARVPTDPGLQVAERLAREYPVVKVRILTRRAAPGEGTNLVIGS